MKTNGFKKILIVGILSLLLVSVVPCTASKEDRPDLTVDEIYIYFSHGDRLKDTEFIEARCANIGPGTVAEADPVEFRIVIERTSILGHHVRTISNTTTHEMHFNNGLPPGENFSEILYINHPFIFPGIITFKCTINPNRKVNETSYENNYCEQTFFGYLGWLTYHWIPIS